MYTFRAVLLMLLGFCLAVSAQERPPLALPACALKCFLAAFDTTACSPIDQACVCTDEGFQNNATACVTASCTIPEALVAKNISSRNCGAPVRNHGQRYAVLSNAMVSIAAAFVVIRFVFKLVYSKLEFGLDDWAVLACSLLTVPSAILTVFGMVKHGFGQDIWTLSSHEITKMLQSFYIMAILYFMQLTLLKLTLLFFYIRVFPSTAAQRLLRGTVIFVASWGFIFVVLAIFQCRPVSFFWTHWDGLHKGRCLDINAITAANAGISILLDFWILVIPLWQLAGLNMHWQKKIGVALMFCVGTFVTVVSILRLAALVDFGRTTNASWAFYDVSVWSTIEICVGIMCACLPTLRLLLVKLFPVLGGSSVHSRQQYYQHGSGNELGNISQSNDSRAVQRSGTPKSGLSSHASRSPITSEFPHDNGITVKISYTVERSHSDTDGASLVSHEDHKELQAT